jgi:hypothetical protein
LTFPRFINCWNLEERQFSAEENNTWNCPSAEYSKYVTFISAAVMPNHSSITLISSAIFANIYTVLECFSSMIDRPMSDHDILILLATGNSFLTVLPAVPTFPLPHSPPSLAPNLSATTGILNAQDPKNSGS